jgi:uncharacterized protein (DUF302 family)
MFRCVRARRSMRHPSSVGDCARYSGPWISKSSLYFGNPKAGTPLMLAAPSSAIDLPLKILVWEDGQGKVWVSYNRPDYPQRRHGFPPELVANIAVVEALAEKGAE